LGYQFPSYDSTYLGDVGKLYEEYALQTGMYDSVTPKYRALGDNPRATMMGEYFKAVAQGVSPDDIIKKHDEQDYLSQPDMQLTETEKDDLKKFASEDASRKETMFEREKAAEYYGIPSPSQTWDIPVDLVAQTRAQKTGLTNKQAIAQEMASLQKQYDQQMANAPKQAATSVKTTEFGFKDNPAAFLFNKVVDAADKINPILANIPGVNGIVGLDDAMGNRSWQDAKISIPVETSVSKSPTAATSTSPRVGSTGKQINQLEKLAMAEADYEYRLADAIAREIETKFGTPYAAAAKEAQRIVASRKKGASGNWLK
jgi:hypothetical protein